MLLMSFWGKNMSKPIKPLGRKAYGSIPHLPGSRMGPADHHCHPGQDAICQIKARDKHDRIIVTEKLDGSNVAIANIGGTIHALGRSGYPAITSPFAQHHYFDEWVSRTMRTWQDMLLPGQIAHGEWLSQAHGTKYKLNHMPFVVFDLTQDGNREPWDHVVDRCAAHGVKTAHVVHDGGPISVYDAISALGPLGNHGALEVVEGVVYRVERKGKFDFMAKYVRSDKIDGKYLPELTGADPVYQWVP
jgi:hypothetical protein